MIIEKYYPFTNPSDYEYDDTKIIVANGIASLKEDTLISGLVLYLQFEDNLIDSSPYNHTVRTTSGHEPQGYVDSTGILGRAIWFKNDNPSTSNAQYVYIDDHEVFNSDVMSIVVWYKLTAGNASHAYVLGKWSSFVFNKRQYALLIKEHSSVQFIIEADDAGQYNVQTQDCEPTTGIWGMAVVLTDSEHGKLKLYHRKVGGCSEYVESSYPGSLWIPSEHGADSMALGVGNAFVNADGSCEWGSQAYDGYVDSVMMYNRLLTEDEIDILWNNGVGHIAKKYPSYAVIKPKQYWCDNIISFSDIIERKAINNEGEIKYRFNDGEKWRYWDGTQWVEATSDEHYNDISVVESHISEFPTENKKIKFEAKLISPTNEEYVGLDDLTIRASILEETVSTMSAVTETFTMIDYLEKVDVIEEVDYIHPKTHRVLSSIFPSGYGLLNSDDPMYKFLNISLFKVFREYEKYYKTVHDVMYPNITYLYEPYEIHLLDISNDFSNVNFLNISGYDIDGVHRLKDVNGVELVYNYPTRYFYYNESEYELSGFVFAEDGVFVGPNVAVAGIIGAGYIDKITSVRVYTHPENNQKDWYIYTLSGVYINGVYNQIIESGIQDYEHTGNDEYLSLIKFPIVNELLRSPNTYSNIPSYAKPQYSTSKIRNIRIIDVLNTYPNGEGCVVDSGEYEIIDDWIVFKAYPSGRPSYDPNFNISGFASSGQPDPGWNSQYIITYEYDSDSFVQYVTSAYDHNLNAIVDTFTLFTLDESLQFIEVPATLKKGSESEIETNKDYILFFNDSYVRPYISGMYHTFLKPVSMKAWYYDTFTTSISGRYFIVKSNDSPIREDYYISGVFDFITIPVNNIKFESVDIVSNGNIISGEQQISDELNAVYIDVGSEINGELHVKYKRYDEYEIVPYEISGYVVYEFDHDENILFVETNMLYEPIVYYDPLPKVSYVINNNIAYSTDNVYGKNDIIRFNITPSGQYIDNEYYTYNFKILDVLRVYDVFFYVGVFYGFNDIYLGVGYLHESELYTSTDSPRDVTLKFKDIFQVGNTNFACLTPLDINGELYIAVIYNDAASIYKRLYKAAYDYVTVDIENKILYFRENFTKIEVS